MRDNYPYHGNSLWRTKSDIPIMYPHFFAKKCQQLAAQGSQFKKMLPGRLGHVAVAIAKWQFQSIDGLHKS